MEQKFHNQQDKQNSHKLSYEYIRGLVEGEGCFTFYTNNISKKLNIKKKRVVPAFVIAMHERDEELLRMMRNTLKLKNSLYIRTPSNKDGYNRGNAVVLVVREFDQLKDIIIPLFYKKLKGHKGVQFINWLEKIGNDPDVSDRFKSLYRLYKWGMYDKLPKFTEKFKE